MEEQEERKHGQNQAAKAHLILLMQAGYPCHKAAAIAGLYSRVTLTSFFG